MGKKKGKKQSKSISVEAAPKKMGRPTLFTKELGEEICMRLSKGESLRSICKDLTPEVEAARGLLESAEKKLADIPKLKKGVKKGEFLKQQNTAIADIAAKKSDLEKWEQKRDAMPEIHAVLRWVIEGGATDASDEKKCFRDDYKMARDMWSDCVFEETIEMADNAGNVIIGGEDRGDNARIAALRLAIDTRKWAVARMAPKTYGDRLDLTTKGKSINEPRRAIIKYVMPKDPAGTAKD